MSARCTAEVFARYPAGGGEFALALALADNAHDDGTHIFPGLKTMAHKSRQDERTVQRHLRTMLASGWLILVKPSVRGRFAEYRISPRWLKGDKLSSQSAPEPRQQQDDKLSSQLLEQDDNLSCHSAANGTTNDAQWDDKSSTPYKNQNNLIPPLPPQGGARDQESKPGTPGTGTPGFDAIAAGYPRRTRIETARDEWDKLAPDAQLQAEIARAIAAWKPSAEWQREGGRFIPKLRDFLRDRRWLDAPGRSAPHAPVAPEPALVQLTAAQLSRNKQRASEAAALARRTFRGEKVAVPA
jgi:hypothetical protein